MKEYSLIGKLHNSTKRKYIERMNDSKIHCMNVARKYEKKFWDGHRRYGYGGYHYIPGYWTGIASKLIKKYNLTNKSKVLDIGCGKGFLLYEIKLKLPDIEILGLDISRYAIKNSKFEIKKYLKYFDIRKKIQYKKNYFDLVISINTLHNLNISKLEKTIKNINHISKNSYIVVESYRNLKELFNLKCWALTANCFFSKNDWKYIFKKNNYHGNIDFIYFT